MKNYGEQLLIARRRKGLRQAAVAQAAGINPATVIDIERERILIQEYTYDWLLGLIAELPENKQVAA
jgi:transcriptional regulator with XRE-family HTH domain